MSKVLTSSPRSCKIRATSASLSGRCCPRAREPKSIACSSRISAGIRARKSRTALSVSRSKNFIVGILDATPDTGKSENRQNYSELLDLSEPYQARSANSQEVASLNIESSNQLLETLEEWNATLNANASSCQERPQYIWNTQRGTQGISGEF